MIEKFSPDFLNEIFKSSFRNKTVFDILAKYMEYHYLPTAEYKEIWKISKTRYSLTSELPTIGYIAEQAKDKINVLRCLENVKNADIVTTSSLLGDLEIFIKDKKFLLLYEKIGDLYEQGKKKEAVEALQEGTEDISSFSLKSKDFESVFKDFGQRYSDRVISNMSKVENDSKCKFGIDSLDARTRGGVDKGTTCLITALSGIGKSKILKWIAYSNARAGKKILHFQFEGTKESCILAYESMITGSPYYDLKTTSVDDDKIKIAIENSSKVVGDIHVIAYERFGTATMVDVRASCLEYIKEHGYPDGIVLDYLDECDPGDGKRYAPNVEGEKNRKQAVAKYFANLCVELNMSGFIATQASDVPPASKNDPNFVLTRSHISGDKGLIKPFSYHITLNRTDDESKDQVIRVYEEKLRMYESGKIHMICTAYDVEKFYDRKRTINIFAE